MNIGFLIKNRRTEKGFTQDQVAKKLFVTKQAISNWENDVAYPSIENIYGIMSVLDITSEYLMYPELERKENIQVGMDFSQIEGIRKDLKSCEYIKSVSVPLFMAKMFQNIKTMNKEYSFTSFFKDIILPFIQNNPSYISEIIYEKGEIIMTENKNGVKETEQQIVKNNNSVTTSVVKQAEAEEKFKKNVETPKTKGFDYSLENSMHHKKILSQRYGIPCNDLAHIHTCVVGGAGSGKTQFFVIPNILYSDTSFVCMDFCGDIYNQTYSKLIRKGYKVYKIDLNEKADTDGFNFLKVDGTDKIQKAGEIARKIISAKHKLDFFGDAAVVFLQLGIILANNEMQNDGDIIKRLTQFFNADKEDINKLVTVYQERDITSLWGNIYSLPLSTYESVKIICNMILCQWLMNAQYIIKDNIDFMDFGKQKCALFVIPSKHDKSETEMIYDFIIQRLIETGEKCKGKRFEIPVHIIFDEFANYFCKNIVYYIAVMTQYNMNISIILQSLTQMENLFKNEWETILRCIGSFLCFDSYGVTDSCYIHNLLKKTSLNSNLNEEGRKISTKEIDAIRTIPSDKCMALIKNSQIIMDNKYMFMD